MSGGPTNETVLRIQALYESGPVGPLDDARLLERFVDRGGLDREDAFAALVRRHGPMVLAACRRMLDGPDADDAFQAVFLVLARKAGSLRRGGDLRPWLYGVAVRTAREARRRAARLRAREAGALDDSRPAIEADPDLFELRAALDEELQRLPGRYREPILLCELEGASRRDAAERLGLAEGTLSSRLARGRSLLRDRLTRRGLAVGTLAAALAPRPSSASGLAALVDASARMASQSAAGTVPAAVATLAEGVLAMLAAARFKAIATAASAALGLLALTAGLAWGFVGRAPRPEPAGVPRADDGPEPARKPDEPQIRGVVLDEDGRPVAGAEVLLNAFTDDEVRATSGPDGSYTLKPGGLKVDGRSILARSADGRSLAIFRYGSNLTRAQVEAPARIMVRPGRDVLVRVADPRGAPVVDAVVEVVGEFHAVAHATTGPDGRASLVIPPDGRVHSVVAQKAATGFDYADFTETLATDDGDGVWPDAVPASITLTLGDPRTVAVKAVDEKGEPAAGVGLHVWYLKKADRKGSVNYWSRIHLATTGVDGVATFDWLPRSAEPLVFWPRPNEGFARRRVVVEPEQSEAVMRLERLATVQGRVVLPDGSPAKDVMVVASGTGRLPDRGSGRTRTTDDGRFEMKVAPGEDYAVWIVDPAWTAPTRFDVVVGPGRTTEAVDFQLAKGTMLKGRATLRADRRPAIGEHVTAQEVSAKTLAKAIATDDASYRPTPHLVSAKVDAQGRYEMRLGPGTYLMFGSNSGGPLVVGDEPELHRDVQIDRPDRGPLAGRVVDAAGAPVADARMEVAMSDGRTFPAKADADGRFRMERDLIRAFLGVWSPEGRLGSVFLVGADEREVVLPVTPTASATGRLLQADGRPAARLELAWGRQVPSSADGRSYRHAFSTRVVTDDEGRFTLPSLVVGEEYEILVRREDLDSYPRAGVVRVEKAGPFDLGTWRPGEAHGSRMRSDFREGSPAVGDVAPAIDAVTLEGEPLRLEDFAGKTVLLAFWATWSGAGLREIDQIRNVHAAFAGDDRLAIVSLSLDASVDAPREFQEGRRLPWSMGFLKGGLSGLDAACGVQAVPAFVLVGPDGRIVARGMQGEGIEEAVAKALRRSP
ncbi:sigma-70 family RNA polymerase sigma factor [Paludisphaera mucosa]|uniref:Sigma-70 family RNA polymerase sigma factor n=1 Tax=Paludisphaera mucosa TaxID=3030827 RepID=A0ABT6FJ89_9BACT|nr:sigma-70 family RNA polymerase sigma factor [Paludisphaera mucosa]MDG3007622.1 sigma-70 family RNA polymerase sigma factor [Paludisphaera mucosa]